MKKIRSILLTLTFIFAGFCFTMNYVDAVSFNASAKNNGNGTVTISVSGKCVGGFNVSVNGKTAQLAIRNIGGSDSTTIRTGSGSFTVKVTAISISDENYNTAENIVKNIPVTVTDKSSESSSHQTTPSNSSKPNTTPSSKPEDNRSKENRLTSLSVSNGNLSPTFSLDKTSYKVELTSDVKSITINATAKDPKAKVSGTGNHELKVGENNFMITVKAENGSKKTYTISVYVVEKPSVFIKDGNKELGVINDYSKLDIPHGYEQSKIQIDGQNVSALKSDKTGLTLVYLQDSQNQATLYIYDNGKIMHYQPLKIQDKEYIVVKAPSDLKGVKGLKTSKVKIGDVELDGWLFEDEAHKNYSVVYLMNGDGQAQLYIYEATEGTLQLYTPFESQGSMTPLTVVFIGTTALASVLAITGFVLYFNFKKKSVRAIKEYYDRKNQG